MYSSSTWRGVMPAAIGFVLAGLVAGCGPSGPSGPAPVVMKGPNDAGWQGPPPQSYSPPPMAYAASRPMPPQAMPSQPMHAGPPPSAEARRTIVVERGESLGRIAARYHVSEHAIVDANHLRPPYKVEIGARLVIPGGEAPPMQAANGPASIPLQGPPPQAGAPPPAPLRRRWHGAGAAWSMSICIR